MLARERLGRDTRDPDAGGHIPRHDRPGPNDRSVANRYTGQYNSSCAHHRSTPDPDLAGDPCSGEDHRIGANHSIVPDGGVVVDQRTFFNGRIDVQNSPGLNERCRRNPGGAGDNRRWMEK